MSGPSMMGMRVRAPCATLAVGEGHGNLLGYKNVQQVSRPAAAVSGDVVDVVAAIHLTKRFGEVLAVDDLTFRLHAGSVTGFLGPNGAGKTTTLRMLLWLVRGDHRQSVALRGPLLRGDRPEGGRRPRGGRLPPRPGPAAST